MPRLSKPVVEDENGELIIPGAYGAAPGGFCERRSTFEWDNNGRALINVDELSVELSDDEDETSAAGGSDSTPSEREAASQQSISTRPADEELGLPPPSSRQHSQQSTATPSSNANEGRSSALTPEEPTEHAIPSDLLDATVQQAPPDPPPNVFVRTFGCKKRTRSKRHNIITSAAIFLVMAVLLGGILVGTQWWKPRQNTTDRYASTATATKALYDPPSPSLAYRGNLGLQDVLAQIVTAPNNLQPNWNSPYWEALYWILYEDPLQLTKEDPVALQQRYLLTAFYFATSISPLREPQSQRFQRRIWKHCAQPTRPPLNKNHTASQCTHQVLTQERPSRLFEPVPQSWRWLSGVSECQWAGVECNADGRVTAVALSDYGLTGTITPEIGQYMTHLRRLSLPYNNHLKGSIPSELLFGRRLNKLELQYNQHNGTFLLLERQEYTEVPTMEVLNLAGNQLSGSLPEALAQMSSLRQISLQENEFTGVLPNGWPGLELLRAQNNQFTGTLSTTLAANTNLRILNLSYNARLLGAIPSEIGLSTKLVYLGLTHAQLTGTIPNELYECTLLRTLDLQHNSIAGTMATQIGQLQRLRQLYWQDNELEGTLPSELGALRKIQEFLINGNDFEGQVPQEFCNLGNNGFPLANSAMVVADCTPNDKHEGSSAIVCPEGCCSQCCETSTAECTNNAFAMLGYGTKTP